MGRKKKQIPKYGTVTLNGIEYFRTRIEDADGKRVALYAKTAEELPEGRRALPGSVAWVPSVAGFMIFIPKYSYPYLSPL